MIKMEKKLYTATVNVQGGMGRQSKAVFSDCNLNLDLRYPKELGGLGNGTNPEQLFVAGFAACFEDGKGLIF